MFHTSVVRTFVLFVFIATVQESVCDICVTCLCSNEDEKFTINCHDRQLANNDMLTFDLLTLDEHKIIHELILSKNGIVNLPRNTLKNLKHLKNLDLSENLINELHMNMFIDLSSLESLNLSFNELNSFDDSLLTLLPSLLKLNLSHNYIGALERTIVNRTKIISLDLSHNNLTDVPDDFLQLLPDLRYLDLSFNEIQDIKIESLLQLSQLTTLRIHNNRVTFLNVQEVPKSLTELHAEYNLIKNILYGTSHIRTLNIQNNYITKIDSNISLLNHLEHLNVSGNALSDFPNLKFKSLEVLDVSYNNMSVIPDSISFENLPVLDKLIISGNPIKELKFRSNVKLCSLEASHIEVLESIDQDAFSKLQASNTCINLTISNNNRLSFIHERALEHIEACSLDFSNNRITHISPKLLESKNEATVPHINLQGNPFHCNCSLQWILNDIVPRLYTNTPSLLDNLRCATPTALSNIRMVHWYKWKERVFCEDFTDFSERMTVEVAGVSNQRTITIDSSTGLLAVLGTAIAVLTILVIVGILLTRRIAMKRTRRNRRF